MVDLSQFRHQMPIYIRWGDMDSMNHVNNARYLTYMETARIEYFKEILSMGVTPSTVSMILARAEVDFRSPIVVGDDITIFTRCNRIGTKSFDLVYALMKNTGDGWELKGQAKTVLVAFDYDQGTPISIPQAWKEILTSYEKVAPELG